MNSQSGNDLRLRSYAALLAGAQEAHPRAEYDQKGYACRWQDNVLSGIPFAEITNDFGAGAGRELDRKLCAAHSSAALVVNTFGPWRTQPVRKAADSRSQCFVCFASISIFLPRIHIQISMAAREMR
jgi:hypothetical protein